jgi:anti-sigma factor RsiW
VTATPAGMSHSDIQELLGAYALDAVDPVTAAAIEEHLNGCVRCSVEIAQHHEVAGLLANSGGSAPSNLWDGIAKQLGGATDQSWDRLAARLDVPTDGRPGPSDTTGETVPAPTVVPIDAGRRRHRRATTGAGLVATIAAALALVFGLQVHHLNGQVNALQSGPQLSAAERAALASPTTRRIPLSSTASTAASRAPATVVLTAAGTGFVIDQGRDGLTPLPADRTYQLWGVVGKRAISLGLLGPRPGIVPFSVAGSATVTEFAITDEVAGGVVSSTQQPVAVGAVRV